MNPWTACLLLLVHAMEKHKERPKAMTPTAAETSFLHIAKAAASSGELPTETVDWPVVFTLANQQKQLPILCEAACKMPAAEENAPLFAAFRIARTYLGTDLYGARTSPLSGPWITSSFSCTSFSDMVCRLLSNGASRHCSIGDLQTMSPFIRS